MIDYVHLFCSDCKNGWTVFYEDDVNNCPECKHGESNIWVITGK